MLVTLECITHSPKDTFGCVTFGLNTNVYSVPGKIVTVLIFFNRSPSSAGTPVPVVNPYATNNGLCVNNLPASETVLATAVVKGNYNGNIIFKVTLFILY